MLDAHQASHGLHVDAVPTGPAAFQAEPQRLRLSFHLAAPDGPARLQPLRVVEPAGVLAEVTEQPLRRRPTTLPFRVVGEAEQLAHPLADPAPTLPQQQAAAVLGGGPGLARALAEDALGAAVQVLAGVEEVQRLH